MKIFECSIIIVNYNGRQFLEPCLTSVMDETRKIDAEVILVDNNSSDGSCDLVAEQFLWVKLIRNNENVGFAAANNRAMEVASAKYIFLLNPDTVVKPGSLKIMIDTMEKSPDIGILSCRLRNSDGSLQFSVGRFPTVTGQVMECLFVHRLFPSFKMAASLVLDRRYYEQSHNIDWALGAALLVRRAVIEKVGKLDEGYFFGVEERDLCYRVKKAGWRIGYTPSAEIVHHGRGWREDYSIDKAMIRGQLRFVRKHYRAWQSALLRGVMLTHVSLRLMAWLMTGIVSREKRLSAWRSCKRYWTALSCCISGGGSKTMH